MIDYGWKGAEEMWALAHDDNNPFLLDDLICETVTVWYGQTEIGKSRLIVGLVASLLRGEPFLDRKANRPIERVLILTADSGGERQYSRRLFLDTDEKGGKWAGLSKSEAVGRICIQRIGTLTEESWADLADGVDAFAPDLVILDPVSRAVNGDMNNAPVANEFYEGLDAFSCPTLVVMHSTIKPDQYGKVSGASTPMGHSNWVNNSRWRVEIRADAERNLSRLECQGNDADKVTIQLAKGGSLIDFRVASETVRSERVDNAEAEALIQARWVVGELPRPLRQRCRRGACRALRVVEQEGWSAPDGAWQGRAIPPRR